MLRGLTKMVGVVLLLAGWTLLGWRNAELARLKERARAEALRADNTQAARDSSRAVHLSILGDSVRLYQRRIVQAKQRSDSVDHALRMERAARYRIVAEVTELRTRIAARVAEQPSDERSAAFRARDGPFYIDAAVTLPRPPGDGRMTVRVRVDTAVFEARVGCGAGDGSGVRPATLTLTGPRWANVRLDRLEQDPRVCSPEVVRQKRDRWRDRARIGVGYGAVLAPDGRVIRGPVLSVTWSVWP